MADIRRFVSRAEQERIKVLNGDPKDYQIKLSEMEELTRLTGEDKRVYARQLKAKYGDDIAMSGPDFDER